MKKTTALLLSATAYMAHPAFADSPSLASINYPNEPVGPSINNPDSFSQPSEPGLFREQGAWLDNHGLAPHLGFTQFYLANPGVGLNTGNHESITLFNVGVDADLGKIFGLAGTKLHFEELYVPYRNHLEFGSETGDVTSNKTAPYIPRVSHLTLFTLEQKLLEDRLTLEAGKSNAGNYFALPLCNVPLGCSTLPDSAGAYPAPYANWGARANYQFSSAFSSQIGIWRSNDAYPFTNGWEKSAGSSGGNVSNALFANVAYRTNYTNDVYPVSLEFVAFHNNGTFKDTYYTVDGTSRVADPDVAVAEKKGISGFYMGAKKTIWRDDGGANTANLSPTAISAYVAGSHVLDAEVPNGISTQASTGLILAGPFKSRPFDTYSVSAHWAQLSKHQQQYIDDAYTSVGSNYGTPRSEYSLGLDANLILTNGVVVSPYVMYTWNPSSLLNPYAGHDGQNGVSAGLLFHIQFEALLGLDSGKHL